MSLRYVVVFAVLLSVIAYLMYGRVKGTYSEKTIFSQYLHSHVFDRSVEAYESKNVTFSLMKVYQAQAALELLTQIAGGDEPFTHMCGDIHSYREALFEQLNFYNSFHGT